MLWLQELGWLCCHQSPTLSLWWISPRTCLSQVSNKRWCGVGWAKVLLLGDKPLHAPESVYLRPSSTLCITLLFSRSVVSNSLQPRGLQHATHPCPSPSPRVCPSSYPLHQWCHLILLCPLLLLPSVFPSITDFCNELAVYIKWPKYWSFSFSISPSNEYSGFISFKIDWFDLLAVQGILRSLLQHHSLKASVLWCSAFFMVQFSQPYVTTGKTMTLTIWTFG